MDIENDAFSGCGISIKNLCLKRSGKQLYNNFSLDIAGGKITAVIGKSGCGKTSLLDVIANLLQPDDGAVQFTCGKTAASDQTEPIRPAYLFQEPRLLPWYSLQKNITIILDSICGHEKAVQAARHVLERVGLTGRMDALPANVSGGERQRAAIARAFAFPSPVLLMDEAFQSQDLSLKLQLMELLENMLAEEKRTVIMVCHDIREALAVADHIVVLAGTPVSAVMSAENTAHNSAVSSGIKIPLCDRYINPGSGSQDIERSILHILAQ